MKKDTTRSVRSAGDGRDLGRAAKRSRVVALIREFNTAIACPGGARRARGILQRAIEAFDRELPGREGLGRAAQAACADPERVVQARILREMKAVHQLWSATETDAVPAEFAHVLDGLLMYEVRADETLYAVSAHSARFQALSPTK